MKQRLGVAAALLKDPELLILDEPTNGLDPAGMRDMRGLIRDLGERGHTVLLSSHLLGEVQRSATGSGSSPAAGCWPRARSTTSSARPACWSGPSRWTRPASAWSGWSAPRSVAVVDGAFRLRTGPGAGRAGQPRPGLG